MNKLNNTEEFICIVCRKKAIRKTKAKKGRSNYQNICRVGARTCSRRCASRYRNNYDNIKIKDRRIRNSKMNINL